jgi:general secretion pathway protein A
MYLDYYQLTKEPFYITPDPAFLFLSESHKQAMANIVYGIGMKKGLMLIIGDIGVGKTMVAQALLARSDSEYLKTIFIDNADISFPDLLHMICRQLGIATDDNLSQMLSTLHQFLLDEDKEERTVALFIDDAHSMPVETLDNLVVLSNLETKDRKLLQIVLIGQPRLDMLLDKNELRHIKQRVAIRATITSLNPSESLAYIEHRLEKAGAKDSSAFTKTALKRIIKEAKGVPRIINVLCDNALVTGFGRQTKSVTSEVADEAIRDLMGAKRSTYFKYFRWQTGVLAGLMCVSIVLLAAFRSTYFASTRPQKQAYIENQLQTANKPASTLPTSQGVATQTKSPPNLSAVPQEVALKQTNIMPAPGQIAAQPPHESAVPKTNAVSAQAQAAPQTSPKSTVPKAKAERGKKMVKIKVKQGDSFIQLIKDFYGRTDKELLAFVKSKNSHIQDIHNLRQGNVLFFPGASEINQ